MTYTPAPWQAGHSFKDDGGLSRELRSVYSADGTRLIANAIPLKGDFGEAEANAHLIAAAPELLEALRTATRIEIARKTTHQIAESVIMGLVLPSNVQFPSWVAAALELIHKTEGKA